MPECTPTHRSFLEKFKTPFTALYSALTILSFHWAVVVYINSSYLEQFLNESDISFLYIAGAILTIIFFLIAPRVLNRFGNYVLTLLFAIIECVALLGMALSDTAPFAALWFTVHSIMVSLLFFHADIFLEEIIGSEEKNTGAKRGLMLTIMSFTAALATLLSGFLIGDTEPRFDLVYLASTLTLIPFIIILIRNFKSFTDETYPNPPLLPALVAFWRQRDIRNVFCAGLMLQVFFVWLVIYAPIYMHVHVGLGWDLIGMMLFVGLLAYTLFEWPIGILADTWIGEKEMMALGFLTIAITTSWIAFLGPDDVLLWFVTMFMIRVGASLVETTTESYFFKQTTGHDVSFVSLYRIARPLAFIIGPIVGSVLLLLLPYNLLFIVLALLMIPGLFFAMALKDTL